MTIDNYLNKIICGDCLEVMKGMPDGIVNCVVTSPPYWGLRDYGVDGQLGLESTPDEYLIRMVDVFREVWRALRDDGTLWLNMGDCYTTSGGTGTQGVTGERYGRRHTQESLMKRTAASLKPKDLAGMPWRLALALQDDGWYLRSDIIWHKPCPMPESVKDRPTRAHEYIFLLSKNERYFYDYESIMEKASPDTHARYARGRSDNHKWADGGPGNQTIAKTFSHMYRKPSGWDCGSGDHHGLVGRCPGVNPKAEQSAPGSKQNASFSAAVVDIVERRNKRTVWTIPPQPMPDAHFATFPESLVRPCMLAGCPEGGVVLDPFMGSGTVAVVAERLGRSWIGIELNPEYVAMAEQRIARATAQLRMFV